MAGGARRQGAVCPPLTRTSDPVPDAKSPRSEYRSTGVDPCCSARLSGGLDCGTEGGTILIRFAREPRGPTMIVVTRIPTHRNDGSKIGVRERRGILNLVRDTFGGYSL